MYQKLFGVPDLINVLKWRGNGKVGKEGGKEWNGEEVGKGEKR